MTGSPYGDRVRDLVEDAEQHATRRDWAAVRALAGAVLALDPGNPDAERLLGEADGAGPEGERRQLTVMFCDVVGSTGLSQSHDPELVHEVLRSYQVTCDEVVRRYDGRIARFIGDGILAYFGHPTTHEDDPRRGVKAGLDLLAAMRPVTEEVQRRYGIDLRVRVAVHTGMVVRADMGSPSTPDRDAIVGETPNLAARLQDHATPGTLVISEATYRLVRGWFLVVPRGAQQLRGILEPVEAYEVVDEVGIDTRIQAQVDLSPFVGRDEELGRLQEAWEGAMAGASATLALLGEPGVGKSRLCDVLRRRASAAGGVALVASCSSVYGSTVLYPVRRLVERSAGIEPHHDPDQALSRLWNALELVGEGAALPYLADLLGIPPTSWCPAPELDGQRLREEVLSSLVRWVRGVAERNPMLVVVDDLQWADATTLELVTRLVSARVPGLLLLLAGRDGCPIPWPSASTIPVDRLTEAELVDLAHRLPEGRRLADADLERIVDRSDGIPLFLEELLRSSSLAPGQDVPRRGEIPSALRDLLLARYAAPGVDLRIGQIVATAGTAVSVGLVAEVLGVEAEVAAERLAPLLAADILTTTVDGGCAFRHRLLADLAYDTQLLPVRERTHGELADAMQARVDEEPVGAAVLAHHLEEAGRIGEAVVALVDAAEEADQLAAHTELHALLAHATELLERLAPEERPPHEFGIRLLRGSTTARSLGFAAAEVAEDFRVCRELVARMNETADPEEDPLVTRERVWSHMGLWANYMLQGELDQAATVNEEILASLQPGNDLHRYFDVQRGFVSLFRGDWAEAEARLTETLDAIRRLELPRRMPLPHDVEVATLTHLASAAYFCGHVDQARAYAEQGLERARSLPFPTGPFSVCYLAISQSIAERYLEDKARVLAWYDLNATTAARHGFTFWSTFSSLTEAIERYVEGDDDALPPVLMTIELLRAMGVNVWAPLFLCAVGGQMVEHGRFEEALPLLEEALEVGEQLGARLWAPEVLHRLGLARVRLGRPEGLDDIRAGADLARRQGATLMELWARTAAVANGGDDEDRALLVDVLERLDPDLELVAIDAARATLAGT